MEEPNRLEQESNTTVGLETLLPSSELNQEIITEGVTKRNPITQVGGGYLEFEGKVYQEQALREINQSLFKLQVDNGIRQSNSNFGIAFPKLATKGDIFVRVDILPNKVFKFDGNRWIEINKKNTSSYMDDIYLEHLVSKINTGEMDVTHLTEQEEEQIRAYLSTQKR